MLEGFDPSSVRAVCFDFDGVILESADIKTDAFADLFADATTQQRAAFVRYHLDHQGISRYEKIRWAYQNLFERPLSQQESEALGQRFSDLALEKILGVPMVEGARELLDCLSGKRPMAVASGTPEGELRSIVDQRGLAPYFVAVHGSPSSKASILTALMAEWKLEPGSVLMIGDASTDHEAANECGTQFVGSSICPSRKSGSPFFAAP